AGGREVDADAADGGAGGAEAGVGRDPDGRQGTAHEAGRIVFADEVDVDNGAAEDLVAHATADGEDAGVRGCGGNHRFNGIACGGGGRGEQGAARARGGR